MTRKLDCTAGYLAKKHCYSLTDYIKDSKINKLEDYIRRFCNEGETMDKEQIAIHGIVNNTLISKLYGFRTIQSKYKVDIQKIIESRIQRLVPHDSINSESLSVPIAIIGSDIDQFLDEKSKFAKVDNSGKSLSVLIKRIVDKVLEKEFGLNCTCRIQVDDNITFEDLIDLVVAIEKLHEYTGLSMPSIESIQIGHQQRTTAFTER